MLKHKVNSSKVRLQKLTWAPKQKNIELILGKNDNKLSGIDESWKNATG